MTDAIPDCFTSIDLEADGNHPASPVEIGIVVYTNGHLTKYEGWLIDPGAPITRHASKIHRLYDRDVAHAPKIHHYADVIRSLLTGATVIGHGVSQDLKILRHAIGDIEPARVIDTFKIAQALLPDEPSYGLHNLASSLKLSPPGITLCRGAHSALYDAALAAELLHHVTTTNPEGVLSYFKGVKRPSKKDSPNL